MMKKNILLLFFLSLAVNSFAVEVEIGGLWYNLISKAKEATVITYKNNLKYGGNIVIPETVEFDGDTYSVTGIEEYAFGYCYNLISIKIPNSVTSIGDRAFQGCMGLATINIPNSVTSINISVFRGCAGLKSVTIPNSVKAIKSYAFEGCSKLISITIPNSVTSIGGGGGLPGGGVFRNCKSLTSITLPDSLSYICEGAFSGCSSLTSIDIPSSVRSIGGGAFSGCAKLTTLNIPNYNSIKWSLYHYYYSGTFNGCSSLTSITIPDYIKKIDENAFANCSSLTSVTIPDSVIIIGNGAFYGCSGLTTINIGRGVETLQNEAFANCSELTDIYCYARKAVFAYANTFEGSYVEHATLHVPEKLIGEYQAIEAWKSFKNIVKMDMPKHMLTYMVDGEIYKTYEIEEGAIVNLEKEPTKEGYTFSGWSEILTMPSYDVTVTGTFTINKYNLTYSVDGVEYKSYEIEYGSSITPESMPAKEGYTFSGWSEIPEMMPAHGVTITGEFSVNTYKLSYFVEGQEYKSFEVEYGSSIKAETEPEKEGYTFSGWSDIPETMPANDVTITGKFTINTYELAYVVDGQEYKSYEIEYGEAISVEAFPEQEGYTFSGWSEIPETMPAHDITVNGSFTVNTYTLTYMIDEEVYKKFDVVYGTLLTPEPEPEKEGYIFSGWSEIPDTMPAKDVTVVGTYTEIPYELSVTITAGKGTVAYNEQSISAGSMNFKLTEGSNATLTITPAKNYKISALTINGENAMSQIAQGVLTLTEIKADVAVNISFERTSDKYTVTMASTMSTLCIDEDLDFTDVSGLEAYIGSGFNTETGALLMTRVYDVPSGTGLLLAGMPGTYEVPYSTSHSIYVNLLEGVTEDTSLEQTSGDYANYLLAEGAQGTGFYAVNMTTVLSAGKAYLRIPTQSAGSRQCISIVYGDATTSTGISSADSLHSGASSYYDMQGRKYEGKPAKRGVYVTNGRKVVVK